MMLVTSVALCCSEYTLQREKNTIDETTSVVKALLQKHEMH